MNTLSFNGPFFSWPDYFGRSKMREEFLEFFRGSSGIF
jgi:hypothetical protein